MKMFYTVLVDERHTVRMESLLTNLRVGLNDWDKTRAFEYYGARYVSYTILCTEQTYETIMKYLYD